MQTGMAAITKTIAWAWTWACICFLTCFLETSSAAQMCRSKSQLLEPPFFELHSCAWCFHYLARSSDIRALPMQPFLFVVNNRTSYRAGAVLVPNVTNPSDVKRVCDVVSQATCERWKECCLAARDCCQRQISAGPHLNGTCGRTWDGWSCWDDAEPGSEEYVSCPRFLQFSVLSSYGVKTCQQNGTWYTRYQAGQNGSGGKWVEWTDYTTCIDKQRLVTSVYLALSCNACSIVFLVPALVIFLFYSSLRRQHRIRLHINFFTALLLANITAILWDVIVTYDRLTSDSLSSTPVLMANGVGCKMLAFLRLYFKSTTYVWMFCEGFYLHRLISDAFRPPKSLIYLYASGWGVPLFYCLLYVILRAVYSNDSCWANSFGNLEWIIYSPNLLCLVVNLFFLCNILRVLLTQLQTHPNEPSNFRRALKATFVLIPLFGVQLFVTIYRLPAGKPGGAEYEQFTVFVTNSQGCFVALIFCFFNGEILRKVRKRHSRDEMNYYLSVIAQMKRTCTRHNLLRAGTEITSRMTNTMATSVHHRDDDNECPGVGVNGSLLQHQGGGGNDYTGDRTPAVNGTRSGSQGHHEAEGRNYSYIPMKTMSSGNVAQSGVGYM